MSPATAPDPALLAALRALEAQMGRAAEVARLLPALTIENAPEERARLVDALEQGDVPTPAWSIRRRRVQRERWRALEAARHAAARLPFGEHYLARLEELELELEMIEALGEPRRVRPLAARRFGHGGLWVDGAAGRVQLATLARERLAELPAGGETRSLPASAPPGEPSMAGLMQAMARAAGLSIEVRVEPRLTAGAATGDRTVFVADRLFGLREARRFAVHEVLGHAVAAANARAQPLRLFQMGSAGSFSIQEGLALRLEEEAGVLDAYRSRVIAARVLVTDRMHAGATFGETARWLHRDEGFSAPDAIGLAERAYRGGGVARDAGYLKGWLAVGAAIESGRASVNALRSGRVGLDLVDALPALRAAGLARPPRHRPSLALSLDATEAGTSCVTSPPSMAASLTMLEET